MKRALLWGVTAWLVACGEGGTVTRLDGGRPSDEAGPSAGGRGPMEAMPSLDARMRDVLAPGVGRGDAAPGRPDSAGVADAAGDAADGAPRLMPLWNGADLSEWEGDPAVWRVSGDAIVGSAPEGAVTVNTFLIYRPRLFGDFVLRAQIWLGAPGNSGIQFRSSRLSPSDFRVSGYQADLGEGYWGALYEERGRGILQAPRPECVAVGRYGEWLDYEIEARGALIVQRLAGVECVSFTETEASRPRGGIVALQYHVPGGFEVRFRQLTILPEP